MGPAYFVIAILGCADGGNACTPIATLQTRYSTETQCAAATAAALIEYGQFDFPTLAARCRPGQKSVNAQQEPSSKRRRG